MSERMEYEKRKELVYEAASALLESGEAVSLEAVKARVGGSYTTLSRALKEWRREHESVKQAQEAPPENLTVLGQRYTAELWKVATTEAQLGVSALKEALAGETRQLQAELAEVLRSADGLQSTIASLEERLEVAVRARADAEVQAQVSSGKVQALETRVEELKAEATELKRMASENSMGGEMARLREQIIELTEQLSRTTVQLSSAGK